MRRLASDTYYFSEISRRSVLANRVPIPNMAKGTEDCFNGNRY